MDFFTFGVLVCLKGDETLMGIAPRAPHFSICLELGELIWLIRWNGAPLTFLNSRR